MDVGYAINKLQLLYMIDVVGTLIVVSPANWGMEYK